MAYGAWPNNPVPLTEDAPLRPNPGFHYAVQRAQMEQLVADWVAGGPGRTAAVLRPCIALAGGGNWVATALAAAAGLTPSEDDPPKQFVHLDDLALAIDIARRRRLDGPFNVAPQGWISGDAVRALGGAATPRLRLPAWLSGWLARGRWRLARGPIPPGLLPYTTDAWVVASDRMRAVGWRPAYTNEEAYVAGTEAKWWTLLSPQRKQELALGLSATVLLGVAAGAGLAVRAIVRRRAGARRA
jgi:nucleoside-diphosphate-sugar epimerase